MAKKPEFSDEDKRNLRFLKSAGLMTFDEGKSSAKSGARKAAAKKKKKYSVGERNRLRKLLTGKDELKELVQGKPRKHKTSVSKMSKMLAAVDSGEETRKGLREKLAKDKETVAYLLGVPVATAATILGGPWAARTLASLVPNAGAILTGAGRAAARTAGSGLGKAGAAATGVGAKLAAKGAVKKAAARRVKGRAVDTARTHRSSGAKRPTSRTKIELEPLPAAAPKAGKPRVKGKKVGTGTRYGDIETRADMYRPGDFRTHRLRKPGKPEEAARRPYVKPSSKKVSGRRAKEITGQPTKTKAGDALARLKEKIIGKPKKVRKPRKPKKVKDPAKAAETAAAEAARKVAPVSAAPAVAERVAPASEKLVSTKPPMSPALKKELAKLEKMSDKQVEAALKRVKLSPGKNPRAKLKRAIKRKHKGADAPTRTPRRKQAAKDATKAPASRGERAPSPHVVRILKHHGKAIPATANEAQVVLDKLAKTLPPAPRRQVEALLKKGVKITGGAATKEGVKKVVKKAVKAAPAAGVTLVKAHLGLSATGAQGKAVEHFLTSRGITSLDQMVKSRSWIVKSLNNLSKNNKMKGQGVNPGLGNRIGRRIDRATGSTATTTASIPRPRGAAPRVARGRASDSRARETNKLVDDLADRVARGAASGPKVAAAAVPKKLEKSIKGMRALYDRYNAGKITIEAFQAAASKVLKGAPKEAAGLYRRLNEQVGGQRIVHREAVKGGRQADIQAAEKALKATAAKMMKLITVLGVMAGAGAASE